MRLSDKVDADVKQTQDPGLFAQSIIDALTSNICVLDISGRILAVNAAWRLFYEANSGAAPDYNYGIGSNYLSVCESAQASDEIYGKQMYAGLTKVMQGVLREFSLEYPCDSPGAERWFVARVTRFGDSSGNLVVAHEDITLRKKYEREVEKLSQRLLTISETERAWVARELHESIAQDLSVLKLNLQALSGSESTASPGYSNLIDNILASLRQMSEALSPVHLESIGLPLAIEHVVEEIAATTGIRYQLTLGDLENVFPDNWNIGFYRIVQYCLHRISRLRQNILLTMAVGRNPAGTLFLLKCEGSISPEMKKNFDLLLLQQQAASFGGSISAKFHDSGYEFSVLIPDQTKPGH